jgi:hypothetical protein
VPAATVKTVEPNPNAYFGSALVLLTESPTYGLIGWATPTYQVKGTVKEMINRGIHTAEEWSNVIFQIIIAFYVMQINRIYIDDFSLENNVYIKDLTLTGQVTEYWKYKVNGIDFYLPNLGYVVMIDSNYRDVVIETGHTLGAVVGKSQYKLNGIMYGTNTMTPDSIDNKIFDLFKECINPNALQKDNAGIANIPQEINNLLHSIYSECIGDSEKNIGAYLLKYMRCYLHNRIGTYLKESEVSNIRRDDKSEIKAGQLVIIEDGNGSFKVVTYISPDSTNDKMARIFTKQEHTDKDIIEGLYEKDSLINYSKADPIMQTFKSNEANMNEDDLLETYVINSN